MNVFELQYLNYGGFCGGCSGALEPFAPKLPKDVHESGCKTKGKCPLPGDQEQ